MGLDGTTEGTCTVRWKEWTKNWPLDNTDIQTSANDETNCDKKEEPVKGWDPWQATRWFYQLLQLIHEADECIEAGFHPYKELDNIKYKYDGKDRHTGISPQCLWKRLSHNLPHMWILASNPLCHMINLQHIWKSVLCCSRSSSEKLPFPVSSGERKDVV